MRFSVEDIALLDAIHIDPKNDAPRLAYADWLIGRGDRRGQFIRAQCEERQWIPARLESGFGRTQPKWWDDCRFSNPPWPAPGWHRPMPNPLSISGYYRGLALLYLPPPDLGKYDLLNTGEWDRILRQVTPAARLSVFLPCMANFGELVLHPLLGRADMVAIAGYRMSTAEVKTLSECPYLTKFSSLNMRNLDEEGHTAFAELIKPILPSASSGEMVHAGGAMYSKETIERLRERQGR